MGNRQTFYCLLWKSRNTIHYSNECCSKLEGSSRLSPYETELADLTIRNQFPTWFPERGRDVCILLLLIVDISSSETRVSKNMPPPPTICPDARPFNRNRIFPFRNSDCVAEREHALREGGVGILSHLKWWQTNIKYFLISSFDGGG